MFGRHRIMNSVILLLLIVYGKVEAFYSGSIYAVDVELDGWYHRDARVAIRNDNSPSCERSNFYICEEPPDLVSPDVLKDCNYRNLRFHEQVFRWVAGRGCLLYTPNFLYVGGVNTINLSAGCFYGNLFAPCLEIAKLDGTCGCYPFDPGLEEVANAVRDAIIPSAHGRWERCFYAARECCSHYTPANTSATDPNQCETTFDGWTCWQEADAGTTAYAVCSEFAYSNVGPSCHHYSSKQCFGNATWEVQTDYSTCSITSRLVSRYRFYIAVLSFSIASCLPAVFVFFFYKRLRITRVALHRNLLISIIIRNILVIVSRSEIYIDELTNTGDTVMSVHGVGCRVLAVAERVAGNAVFICMLVEGVYLHRLIVAVFRQKLRIKWLYAIGAVITFTPAIIWAAVMAMYNDHSCWLVYTVEHVQWILDAPRLVILLVNTALFVDVLRVLLTKIRNTENANQLSTAKATLFLMPLFGTQFLLTAFRPNTSNCTGEQIYYYVSYTVEGLQGFVVALLYCYINKEVHILIKGTYKKTESAVVSRIRRDSNYPRVSTGLNSDRRVTYSTELPDHNEDLKNDYTTVNPKLHVAEVISIQATERLAEILEPVYETIQNGNTNAGYDSLEHSDGGNKSDLIPKRDSKIDDYYNFTNASSVSIDCQDWIRCVSSPSSSVYNNSLNEYETKYLEHKFPNHPKVHEVRSSIIPSDDTGKCNSKLNKSESILENKEEIGENDKTIPEETDNADNNFNQDMFNEIMQYIEINESRKNNLDADRLCPNRKDDDKIFFVEE